MTDAKGNARYEYAPTTAHARRNRTTRPSHATTPPAGSAPRQPGGRSPDSSTTRGAAIEVIDALGQRRERLRWAGGPAEPDRRTTTHHASIRPARAARQTHAPARDVGVPGLRRGRQNDGPHQLRARSRPSLRLDEPAHQEGARRAPQPPAVVSLRATASGPRWLTHGHHDLHLRQPRRLLRSRRRRHAHLHYERRAGWRDVFVERRGVSVSDPTRAQRLSAATTTTGGATPTATTPTATSPTTCCRRRPVGLHYNSRNRLTPRRQQRRPDGGLPYSWARRQPLSVAELGAAGGVPYDALYRRTR